MSWKKKLLFATTLVGSTTVAISFINRIISFNATKSNILRRASGEVYDWRFGKVFYKKIGIGSPLLLVHDLNAFASADEWDAVINELAREHTVYALDLLGCGRSEKPNLIYTNYMYAQLINDFIKQVIGSRTDVVTSGASGPFVLTGCFNDNSIYNRIFMVSPPNPVTLSNVPSKKTKFSALLIKTPVIGTLLYHLLHRKSQLSEYFYSGYMPSPAFQTYLDTCYESANGSKSGGKYLFASAIGRYTTVQLSLFIKSLNNSVYLLTGENTDEQTLYEQTYQKYLPSLEIDSITQTGRLPHLERPQEFIEHLRIFME